MIIDYGLTMSNGQAVTVDAASTVLDFDVAGTPVEPGMYLYVKTDAAFASTVSIDISFQTSSDNFSSDTTTLYTKNFLLAALTINTELIRIQIPLGLKRYARMYYDVNTTATAGAFVAAIVPGLQNSYDVS